MARFHWLHSEDLDDLDVEGRKKVHREAIRSELQDGMGDRIGDLMSKYPWLSPGVVAALAKTGIDPTSEMVQELSRMEASRRTEQEDWQFPGDEIKEKPTMTVDELFGGVTHAAEEETPQEGTDVGAVSESPAAGTGEGPQTASG